MNQPLEEFKETFRNNLKRLREQQGYTQIELSTESGYEASYVGKLERGDSDPSLDSIRTLCETLDVDPAELLLADGGTDESDVSETEAKLRASKIELEMQQEELTRTEDRLRNARDYYWSLFNRTPFPLVTLDLEGNILEVNDSFRNQFVAASDPGTDQHINAYLTDEDRDTFYRYRNAVQGDDDPGSTRLRFVDNDDRTRICRVRGAGLNRTDDTSAILLAIDDVTDLADEISG